MAQPPPRHRHGRHRGTGNPRKQGQDTMHTHRQPTLVKTTKEANQCHASKTHVLSSQEKQELRQALIKIQEQAKAMGNKPKDTQDIEGCDIVADPTDFSKNAQDKLLLACKGFSNTESEDIDLLATVVFALFNSDLLKSSGPASTHQRLVESLCTYFLSAFRHYQSRGSPPVDASGKEQVDILRALSSVLFENGAMAKEHFTDLFEIITGVCGSQRQPNLSPSSELRRMALNCLANLVHKTGSLYAASHDKMYEILYLNLTGSPQYEAGSMATLSSIMRRKDRASERKLVSSALRALHFLLQEDKQLSVRSITPIMDVICKYMFFTSENGSAQPSLSTSTSVFTVGVLKRQSYLPPSSNTPVTKLPGHGGHTTDLDQSYLSYRSVQSSDSEYSDTESGIHQIQRRQHDGKVRLNALLCLQALARTASKQLQPHWPKFLTTSNTPATMYFGSHKTPSLVGIIGTDPIPTVRSAACVVLANIMESSKQYLAMAEEKVATYMGLRSQTGVMALSERVGLMTRELHTGLAAAIARIDDSLDHTAAIQMVKCCASVVASCSYERMRSGLPISLYDSIKPFISHTDPGFQTTALSFVSALLGNTTASVQIRETVLTESEVDSPPNLLQLLLRLASDRQTPALVCVEAWGTLRSLAQHHFAIAQTIWQQVDKALEDEQDTEDLRLRSAGLMFLDEYLKSASHAQRWKDVLERHVLQAFAEDNPAIKALGCDWDSTHVLDMASAVLDLCHDPNMAVRVRASWAVGNLCDSLVLLKSSNTEQATVAMDEILTLPTWTRIMRTALMISQDHEKLKSNGIRAIGGLLRVTFEGILERERHSLVKDAVNVLIKNIEQGSLKGRWNACYAIQNVLLNNDFPIGSTYGTSYACDSDEVSWTDQVYSALLQAVQQSRNFKVRINACAALTVPKTRVKYGNQSRFRNVIEVLLKAVDNLDNKYDQGEHDYGEFQYRDQLELKLLRCLDHLLQLAMSPPSPSSTSISAPGTGGSLLGIEIDPAMKQRIVASRIVASCPVSTE
ncbi:HEAT repeat-containing protein 6 [Podila minutissima]|uniref:HEAT repeat-containing protein 6 n=1 Tax=Podila minutissima TaxID=64525 RepID=A0A9P5SUS9_9FUNG|nr:HEAT repeat-containing protein 6 [Podila minutissima]